MHFRLSITSRQDGRAYTYFRQFRLRVPECDAARLRNILLRRAGDAAIISSISFALAVIDYHLPISPESLSTPGELAKFSRS